MGGVGENELGQGWRWAEVGVLRCLCTVQIFDLPDARSTPWSAGDNQKLLPGRRTRSPELRIIDLSIDIKL